jgi:hypothetical protein
MAMREFQLAEAARLDEAMNAVAESAIRTRCEMAIAGQL